jgi:hypothetical protein
MSPAMLGPFRRAASSSTPLLPLDGSCHETVGNGFSRLLSEAQARSPAC